MTLSFHKVQFDAQEILDMAAEAETLLDFQNTFCDLAEERSRLNTRLGDECPTCGDTYHDLPRHLQLNYKGCATDTPVVEAPGFNPSQKHGVARAPETDR